MAGQGISFLIIRTWPVREVEIEPVDAKGPSGLLRVEAFGSTEVFEISKDTKKAVQPPSLSDDH